MTYKEAYKQILDWLIREHELLSHELEEIEADLKDEGVPSRGSARNLIRTGARAVQVNEIVTEMENTLEDVEDTEQSIAIKFCHEHKLLMVPVEAYHQMNVSAYAYANGLTYEEAEKRLLNKAESEVKPNE